MSNIKKIGDLPDKCKVIRETLETILTYEKLIDNNYYMRVHDDNFDWIVYFNISFQLRIPKNISINTPSSVVLNIYNNEQFKLFKNEISEFDIIIEHNKRTLNYSFYFKNQEHIFQFYYLCKKYGYV